MSNYEPFFSLQRPLFDSHGERGFVYESDQLKSAAESFKTAFSRSNPLLCVGGQLGCGKSSTVNYALGQLDAKTRRLSVGRVRLTEDEVIDLLLEKLNVEDQTGGIIKKLGRFANRVEELRKDGERVVVIVEDAARTGANIVTELDVLCGGDAGADIALVVCGDESLRGLLKTPEFAPISQRMSDFVRLAPFAVDEMEDYLRSAVSAAGGDYDGIFGKDYAGLTHILSCGVPRVANKLTEASLEAAAKAGTRRVSCALLADVARSRFDIETELPVHRKATTPKQAPRAAATPPAAASTGQNGTSTAKQAPAEPTHRQMPDVSALTGARAERDEPDANAPAKKTATAETRDEVDIPHLIQDTQPELKALAEEVAADKSSALSDHSDDSGAFVSLPNLEDLTAEFAAVSQMIESLPTSRYDLDEVNTEIEDAFGDFGTLDKALEPPVLDGAEPEIVATPNVDATSTALPRMSIPEDPTLNEAPAVRLEKPVPPELVPEPEPAKESGSKGPAAAVPPDVSPTIPDVPVLEPESLEPVSVETKKPTPDAEPPHGVAVEPAVAPAVTPTSVPRAAAPAKEPARPAAPAPRRTVDQKTVPAPEVAIEVAEVKDWDRDPTLAELKPDLDALELAMGEDIELSSEPEPMPEPKVELKPEPRSVKAALAAMPEITLDNSIQEKVEEAVAESAVETEQKTESTGGPTDTEVHRMMEDLSKANSLEDMDDKLAETLFGDEINLVASQVLKAARESMERKSEAPPVELSLEQTAQNPIPETPATQAKETVQKAASLPPQYAEDEGEVIDLKSMKPNSGLDMSASQRLRTVRALNAGMGAAPPPTKPKPPAPPKEKPVPIEDQIDLSMTATFKALKIDPNALQQQGEEETEKKGFFSRFRKKG